MLSNLKATVSIILMLFLATFNSHAVFELQFDQLNSLSSFQMESGGSDQNGYTFTVVNPDATVPAFINFKQLGQRLDDIYKMVTFEYRATAPGNPRVLGTMVNLNFVRVTGSATNILYQQNIYTTDSDNDGWYRMTFDISSERSKPLGFGRVGTHVLWVHFVGIPAGTTITIRNPKIAPYEFAETLTTIDGEKETLISPESFHVGLHNRYGHNSRQPLDEAPVKYSNPAVAERFPILAWNGIEPHANSGSIDWERLESDFKDFWECGFSLTMPTGNPQANAHCIWDNIGRFVFNGTGLKMFLKPNDLTDDEIKYYAGADRLAGWFIRDEPFVFQFNEMRKIVDRVTTLDKEHILYGNIFGWQGGDPTATGARDYDDYVNKYLDQVGIGYISYDFYPVRQYISSGERFVHPLFFCNLETISRISKARGIPFWGFVHSVESNCGVEGTKYPTPSIEEMKIEAFCALAYGAQGIQYFTYGCPYDPEYNYCNSPLDSDGNKTPTWDMVRSVNAEINALRNVFLGANVRWVAHTAESVPEGCRSLTSDMLPDGFNDIKTDTSADLCISRFSNTGSEYLMVVNPELNITQNVTFDKNVECRQITPTGIIESAPTAITLAPGEYVILLLNDVIPATPDNRGLTINNHSRLTDSRSHISEIDMRRSDNGEVYINNMGNENWQNFSLSPITADGLTISPEQAEENWGAWFSYTVDVPQDGNYDIRIRHAVPWDSYHIMASSANPTTQSGLLCADYRLDYDGSVNWPKAFTAAMIMEVDGQPIMPSNQPYYPSAPDAADIDGSAYNAMLSDPSSWIMNNNESVPQSLQAVLRFWPEGGNNTPSPKVNDKPDYAGVTLTAGQHVIKVRSLCSPWQFYGVQLSPSTSSSIDTIINDNATQPVQWFDIHGLPVTPDRMSSGLYIRKQGTEITKIAR